MHHNHFWWLKDNDTAWKTTSVQQLTPEVMEWLGWSIAPVHQTVADLIPGQGTYLGRRFEPWVGHMQEANPCFSLTDISLSVSLPFSLSLKSILKKKIILR